MAGGVDIIIWTPDESQCYAADPGLVSGLSFSSLATSGFATCSWDYHCDPLRARRELQLFNKVQVMHRGGVVWEGRLSQVSVKPTEIHVEADGEYSRLLSRYTTTGVAPGKRGSSWIFSVLLQDEDLSIPAGDIRRDDFIFPYGLPAEGPRTYAELLENINRSNGYHIGIWEDGLHFRPFPEEPEYVIDAQYEGIEELTYSLSDVVNHYYVRYTRPDDSEGIAEVQDSVSISLYGRRDAVLDLPGRATSGHARAAGILALKETAGVRPMSSVDARRVYHAASGREIPVYEIRAGRVLRIDGLMAIPPGETTFLLAEVTVDCDNAIARLSPGRLGLKLGTFLAKLEARTRE